METILNSEHSKEREESPWINEDRCVEARTWQLGVSKQNFRFYENYAWKGREIYVAFVCSYLLKTIKVQYLTIFPYKKTGKEKNRLCHWGAFDQVGAFVRIQPGVDSIMRLT